MSDFDYAQFNNSMAQVTNAASVIAGQSDSKLQREWREKMYERDLQEQRADIQASREYNEAMYNKYSSPAALKRQFEVIGVNPNDIAANIAGANPSPSSATSVADGGVPSGEGFQTAGTFNNAASTFANLALNAAQIDKLKADAEGQKIDNNYKDSEKQLSLRESESRIKQNEAQVEKILRDADLSKLEATKLRSSLPYLVGLTEAQFENVKQATAKAYEETRNLQSEYELIKEQIETEKAKQKAANASADASSASAGLMRQQTTTETYKTNVEEYNRDLKKLEYQNQQIRNHYEAELLEKGIDPNKVSYSTPGGDWSGYYILAGKGLQAVTEVRNAIKSSR